jgi:hypothetical protein
VERPGQIYPVHVFTTRPETSRSARPLGGKLHGPAGEPLGPVIRVLTHDLGGLLEGKASALDGGVGEERSHDLEATAAEGVTVVCLQNPGRLLL